MSRRKKKQHHEEEIPESWLLPYSDVLTLLLALFIVLFASSSVDATKFQSLSQSFNQVLSGGEGIMELPNPIQENDAESLKIIEDGDSKQKEKSEQIAQQVEQLELENIQRKVNTYIQKENLSDKLDTSLNEEGLLVRIRDNVLFDSGSAQVRKQDIETARDISELLVMNPPRDIIISGHTDNVPISNPQFASNWELSVMRAINFMKILLQNQQLDPSWFSTKGFGEFQPIAPNDSAEGRSQNRRVEILIMPRSGD